MKKKIKKIINKLMRKPVIGTRFAPSPTGFFHAGSYRTALFSYLYARQNHGKFILRIEDTDKERSKPEYESNIIESLKWMGLDYDEMHRQSDRTEIYKKYLKKLIDENKIYISKEEVKEGEEGEGKRGEVIRFRNPNRKVKFNDTIRGEITFDTTELGDFVIAKSLTEPLFHFVVVLDDYLMGVTHVIRGEDHISNTPRHILIQEALGAPIPTYSHLPLVLASDRSKLSKRHGAKPMTHYRDMGYLPQALLNYMCLLGWNDGTEKEIFKIDELIEKFDLSKIQKGGAIFNEEKLRWVNKEHLKLIPKKELNLKFKEIISSSERARELKWNVTNEIINSISGIILERIDTYGDVNKMIEERDLDYYFDDPKYDAISLGWKDDRDILKAMNHLKEVKKILSEIPPVNWQEEKIKALVWPYADANGRGNVLWPLRFCLSGKDKSPNPFTLSEKLGKEITLRRIDSAIDLCAQYELEK